MNRIKYILLVAFLLVELNSSAQVESIIHGVVYDSLTNLPLPNAEIINLETSNKTFSDEKGSFLIKAKTMPCVLEIHILGGSTKKVQVMALGKNVEVFVCRKALELAPVDIIVNVPIEMKTSKKFYITDYEFSDDKLIVLAYDYNNMMAPMLLLTNQNGDTLSQLAVWKAVKLCKDFDGKVFFVNKTTSFEITTEDNELKLANPISNEEFEATNSVVIDHVGDYYFMKQLLCSNQLVNFFNYDEINDSLKCFRSISDQDNIARNRWGAYFDGKEEDIRFQELIMKRTVNASYIRIADTIYLFNFLEAKLEKYSMKADTLAAQNISFQNDRSFTNQLFIDRSQLKAYNLFVRNGISELKEINMQHGTVERAIQIPKFVFIENIKVHNGNVYFLYKEKYLEEHKKLYKMKI